MTGHLRVGERHLTVVARVLGQADNERREDG